MTIQVPDYEHAVLYYPANPAPYGVGEVVGKGFLLTPAGLGDLDFSITGIIANPEHPLCATPVCIGILDEYAGLVRTVQPIREEEIEFIRTGDRVTEPAETKLGIDPLRTLLISDAFGGDTPGGLTIYGVDVQTNIPDAIFVGIASRLNIKDDFIFRKWCRIKYPNMLARPVVSGREFKLLLYTKGAGQFIIKAITVWAKLTDRRGFNTSPKGAQSDSAAAANAG
jgi:hypothetical protein